MFAETLEDFIDLNYANGLSSIVVKIHEFKFQCHVMLSLPHHIFCFTQKETNMRTKIP